MNGEHEQESDIHFFPIQDWVQLNETARTQCESKYGVSPPAGSSPVGLLAKGILQIQNLSSWGGLSSAWKKDLLWVSELVIQQTQETL